MADQDIKWLHKSRTQTNNTTTNVVFTPNTIDNMYGAGIISDVTGVSIKIIRNTIPVAQMILKDIVNWNISGRTLTIYTQSEIAYNLEFVNTDELIIGLDNLFTAINTTDAELGGGSGSLPVATTLGQTIYFNGTAYITTVAPTIHNSTLQFDGTTVHFDNQFFDISGILSIHYGARTLNDLAGVAALVWDTSGIHIPKGYFDIASQKFEVDSTGNVIKINNITQSWPSVQGLASTFLKNDGSGNLTWSNPLIPRIVSIASSATPTPNIDTTDMYIITALSAASAFGVPVGTPNAGQSLMVRIKDDGTARALTYNAIYRASSDLALPSTTIMNKTLYMKFIYNSVDTKWDLLTALNNF
jgi:hypothetical protein